MVLLRPTLFDRLRLRERAGVLIRRYFLVTDVAVYGLGDGDRRTGDLRVRFGDRYGTPWHIE